MKLLFDFNRCTYRQPKVLVAGLALVFALAAGCGKSSNGPTVSVAPPSSTTNVAQAPGQQVTPSAPVAVANADIPKPEMQAMNRALLDWMRANNRRPKTFQEFASSTDFQIPAPPAGKKYAFNERGFIVLVDASN
ncbi:MAG TPA: hypothetical protein VMH87_08325 [Pseudomonadales bacterium]|nr:hypothetical protein [Pseudomonadales bacterium]